MKVTFLLDELDCPSCGAKIEHEVGQLEQVEQASLNFVNKTLTVSTSQAEDPTIEAEVKRIVDRIEPGMTVQQVADLPQEPPPAREKFEGLIDKPLIFRLAGGVLLLVAAILMPAAVQWVKLALFIASYLLIGADIVWVALRNIVRGQFLNEDFLMSLATVAAFATGQYPEAVSVMLFYQIGEFFQHYAVNRSRRSIAALIDIRPDYANLKTADGWAKVHPAEVKPGDVIVVKPGEKIPLDGIITEGFSALDTAALTGESMPSDVGPGSIVLSGCINQSGVLVVSVQKSFGDSTASKILELVENAAANKATTENFITKFARYYTPAVVGAALLLAVIPPLALGLDWMTWLNRALVFLVVSCPCALVLSIPLSFFGGIGAASINGILIKGSNFLEALNQVETVVFDKTGTLTKGVFTLTKVSPAENFPNLLEIAAYAEHFSSHPIAVSIKKAYSNPVEESRLSSYHEIAGQGISVLLDKKELLAGNRELMKRNAIEFYEPDEAGTLIYVAYEGKYVGWLLIADESKPDSKMTLEELKSLGILRTVMLTGDRDEVALQIAEELGLGEVRAGLLPQDKVTAFEELKEQKTGKGSILFVGDGLNDAPVLAMADVGVAMGGIGSDAAIEAADVVLMTDEPYKLVQAIKIARFTHHIVWQNIVFALGVKLLVLLLGAAGFATLWAAVFADVGVALIAVLNTMRILAKFKKAK